jgi:hypothetical protein
VTFIVNSLSNFLRPSGQVVLRAGEQLDCCADQVCGENKVVDYRIRFDNDLDMQNRQRLRNKY